MQQTLQPITTGRLVLLMLLVCLMGGCGNRPQLRDDPFGGSSRGPRLSNPFRRSTAAERDTTEPVSTSPSTDPFYGDPVAKLGENVKPLDTPPPPAEPVSSDPLHGDAANPFGDAPSPRVPHADPSSGPDSLRFAGAEASEDATDSGETPRSNYQQIRDQLDQFGARNLRLETDHTTGETFFSAEVPNPKDPAHLRVFEARHADDLAAMRAVAEAIEKWVTEQRRNT